MYRSALALSFSHTWQKYQPSGTGRSASKIVSARTSKCSCIEVVSRLSTDFEKQGRHFCFLTLQLTHRCTSHLCWSGDVWWAILPEWIGSPGSWVVPLSSAAGAPSVFPCRPERVAWRHDSHKYRRKVPSAWKWWAVVNTPQTCWSRTEQLKIASDQSRTCFNQCNRTRALHAHVDGLCNF